MIQIEQMIVKNRADCTGCYACYNVCPVQAISMIEDKEGFRYPQVNTDSCLKCGACGHVCPVLNPPQVAETGEPATYAAINDKKGVRQNSSSGGIFHALAERVLQEGGVVFGAGFDDNWEVSHQPAEIEEELAALQVSKYLQSRAEDVYQKVRQELSAGRKVLFSGTPCQCAALRSFLRRDDENLLLVDFICHGVPSPAVWREYLAKRTGGEEIQGISFRNKNLSWERYLLAIFFKNANKYLAEDLNMDLYLKGFLQNLYLRPSCHECHFCRQNRPTDITLADFWGVAEELPEAYDSKGTSLVFVHSDKGQDVFSQVKVRKWQVEFAKAVKHNPSMISPAVSSDKREPFFKELIRGHYDIMTLLSDYTRPPLKARVRLVLRKVPGLLPLVRVFRSIWQRFG